MDLVEIPEIVVTDHWTLGRYGDSVVDGVRTFVNNAMCLPICWLYLTPSVKSFQKHKHKRVEQGTATVVRLQKAMRHPLLDPYFTLFSFFGEEEWYLLCLPILFWNFDDYLARHITILVTGGLAIGNTGKDIFELPRPASPPVWRPSNMATLDSTDLQDFGFPSTHR